MSKARINGKKKNIGIVKKLQKSLLLGRKSSSDDHFNDSREVPEDAKEGHFAVIAMEGEEVKKFVVPLSCLSHPSFLRLLEQAAEEYGFDHEGALTVPCSPSEMDKILAEIWVADTEKYSR